MSYIEPKHTSLTPGQLREYIRNIPVTSIELRDYLWWYINPSNGWSRWNEPTGLSIYRDDKPIFDQALELFEECGRDINSHLKLQRAKLNGKIRKVIFFWEVKE